MDEYNDDLYKQIFGGKILLENENQEFDNQEFDNQKFENQEFNNQDFENQEIKGGVENDMIKVEKIPEDILINVKLNSNDPEKNVIFKILPKQSKMKLGKRYLVYYLSDKLSSKFNLDKSIFDNLLKDRDIFNPNNLKEKFEKIIINNCEIKTYKKVDEIINEEIKIYNNDDLKPDGPTDNTWFSNFNEDDVLKDLMEWCPWFYAHKSCMSDFMIDYNNSDKKIIIEKSGQPLIKLGFATMNPIDYKNNNYTCSACVVNSDTRGGNGTHWTALFYDMRSNNHTIEFFNSTGSLPKLSIKNWMKEFAELSTKELGIECKPIIVSNIEHQNSNSECGAYSIYFIIARLIGIPYKKFRENPIPDKVVFQFRKSLFLPEKI